MALQTTGRLLAWPGNCVAGTALPTLSNAVSLTTSGNYDAIVMMAPFAMTVSHIGFLPNASSSGVAEVRLETVDTSTGLPSGTLWATNTNGTTGTLVAGTWVLQALTASATFAEGDVFAVMIKYSSGTSFAPGRVSNFGLAASLPYAVQNGAKLATAAITRAFVLASNSTTFYNVPQFLPITAFGGGTFNNTNSARRALRFQVPFNTRCAGLRFYAGSSNGNFNVAIYDDAGTEVGSSNTAITGKNLADAVGGQADCMFDSPATLSPATWYRASVEPSSATNVNVITFQLPTADYRTGMPGGLNCHYATFASGTWTDTPTDQVPLIDVLLDQLDDGISSAPFAGSCM